MSHEHAAPEEITFEEISFVELSPEEVEQLERAQLGSRRNQLLSYAADVFHDLGWRVHTTAELAPDGTLTLRAAPTNIQGYFVAVEFSRERLLDEDQSKNEKEIELLPEGMIDHVFGSQSCALVSITQPQA